MEKLISTKKTFKTNDFKIIIGSTNKKNPLTFYAELNSFIEPVQIKNKYNDIKIRLDKETEQYINDIIQRNKLSDKYIKDIKFSTDSLEKKGKSYLSISIMFMQNKASEDILMFPEIYEKLSKEFDNEHNKFKEIFYRNNLNIIL